MINQSWSRGELEAYCRTHAVKKQADVAVVLGDVRLIVPQDDEGITQHLLYDGFWESWVTLAASRRVRPGMRVLNIGANCGYYTVLFASLGAEVLAVEPQLQLVELLSKTISMSPPSWKVSCLRAAVGAEDGEVILRVPPASTPGQGKKYMNASLLSEMAGVEEVVPQVTLSRFFCGADRPEYVFCDAEGWEPHIFQPAAEWLMACRPVITLEFSPRRYAEPEGFARWWGDLGYAAYRVEYDGSERRVDLVKLAAFGDERMVTLVPA